ncbi:hypothetical protein ACEWY4_027823 [Coilia grayii]|uniref:HAT C-terminal dimerisation domain-containing protein n=1 Tax=Coilia grayii TaxID=363190 RepID=A0ABD1INJ6_9TELE
MLNSIARQHNEIRQLLEEKGQEHRFEGIQVEVLNGVGEFLTPFKHASEDLEGDRYPTINSVLLWSHRLRRHCEPRCGDPLYMQHIRRRAGELLDEKMIISPIHKIATFLSPRFKTLKVYFHEKPFKNALKRCRMFLEWEDTPDLIEPDEIQRYMQSHFNLEECSENVLGFWGAHSHDFPLLSMLARAVLCVPATSASSERAFSSAGRVLEARRNRLNPGTVDSILFLHSASKQP